MSEVYDRYVDTAGNYHYTDIETGHHVIPNTAVSSSQSPHLIKTNAEMFQDVFGRFPYLPCEDGCYIDVKLQDRQWWDMPFRRDIRLLNKSSEIEDARKMPNSEIEKYIQLTYKRESNRRILRERLIEGKAYREIIERHYFSPVGDWMEEEAERVVNAWTNEIQRMETKFYRVVHRNRRMDG